MTPALAGKRSELILIMCKATMHIITGLNKAGAEMLLFNLLLNNTSKDSRVIVVSLVEGGALQPDIERLGIKVYSLAMKRGIPSLKALFDLYKIIKSFKPDVIQGWMYHANLLALIAAKMCKVKPLLFWGIFHSIDDLSKKKRLLRYVVKLCAFFSSSADAIVNNSHNSALQHANLGYKNNRSIIISNGIDTDKFFPRSDAYSLVCQEFGLPKDVRLVTLIGRFDPLKDHMNFLRAAQLLSKKTPLARFLLIGKGVDNANLELLAQIRQLGLQEFVLLLGERSDIPRLAASADVCVSSSLSEGTPVSIGESMSCGVPCVVTDVGDSASLVSDTGLIVPHSEPSLLAEAIYDLLSLPQEERKHLGLLARDRIIKHYSMENFVSSFETLHKGC